MFLFFALPGHAAWWTSLLKVGEEAAEVAGKTGMRTGGRTAVQALKSGSAELRAAHALNVVGSEVRAVDATGKEVLIAAAASVGGALALTPDGANLLKQVAFVVSESDVGRLGDLIKDALRTSGKSVSAVRGDGSIGRLVLRTVSSSETLLMEKYPGIFVDVGAKYSDEVAWALKQSFRRDRVRVISLLDPSDADELARLDGAVGEFHSAAGSRSTADAIRLVRAQREKTVFVVGHVEADRFVVRDAAGHVKAVMPFVELEDAARRSDAALFLLGCSAGACATASALLDPVNALHVADGLKNAIAGSTLGDAVTALSTAAGDLVITPQLVGPSRMVLVAEQRAATADRRILNGYRLVRVATLGAERSSELADRIIPYVPSWVQLPYFIGLFFLLFSVRQIIRDWKSFRQPAPAFSRRPIASIFVRALRTVGFLLLMPFAVALSVMITIGGWCLGTVVPILILGWPVVVPIYFGWRWARSFRDQWEEEMNWLTKYLAAPIFVACVTFVVSLMIGAIDEFKFIKYADFPTRVAYWLVAGLIALAVSALAYRFLTLKKWRWGPADIPGLVVAGPLFLIEWGVSRATGRVEAANG